MKNDVTGALCAADKKETDNAAYLLSALSEKSEKEIEAMLRRGVSPWLIANELDVLFEFKDEILSYMITKLNKMVEENRFTQEEADELVAEFEMNFAELNERFSDIERLGEKDNE